MRPVVINGYWCCLEKISGVSRYAYEVIKNMDSILDYGERKIDIRVTCPSYSNIYIDDLHNISIVRLNSEDGHFTSNTQKKYIKSNNGIWCALGNSVSYNRDGVVCMHDIRDLVSKEYYTKRGRKLMRAQKWSAKVMNSTIVTVSEYSKNEICRVYRFPKKKVFVIPNGWEHIEKIECDNCVFFHHPEIKKDNYYYAIGSVAKHKNYKWIHEIAKKYKDRQFVIAGNVDKNAWGIDDAELHLPNIIFMGYVSDGENKALMQHCRALLFPSKYEGFGIPPLEALALGKKIIISNATCLPEIYGESAAYFNPDDYDVDLDKLEAKPTYGADKVLEKYTWKNAARMWLDLFVHLGATDT